MAYCSKCGAYIPEGMGFCGKCGEQLDSRLAEENKVEMPLEAGGLADDISAEKKSQVNKKLIIILAAVAIVAVVLIIIFFNQGNAQNNEIGSEAPVVEQAESESDGQDDNTIELIEVPNLVGLVDFDEILSVVSEAGFFLGEISCDEDSQLPIYTIVQQSPKGGEMVPGNSSIDIVLSVPVEGSKYSFGELGFSLLNEWIEDDTDWGDDTLCLLRIPDEKQFLIKESDRPADGLDTWYQRSISGTTTMVPTQVSEPMSGFTPQGIESATYERFYLDNEFSDIRIACLTERYLYNISFGVKKDESEWFELFMQNLMNSFRFIQQEENG